MAPLLPLTAPRDSSSDLQRRRRDGESSSQRSPRPVPTPAGSSSQSRARPISPPSAPSPPPRPRSSAPTVASLSSDDSGAPSRANPVALASVESLSAYGAGIASDLSGAEAELASPNARPFSGLAADVMADVERLRREQMDVFRQHVEIEQRYRVPHVGGGDGDVRDISFGSIAGSMREKEIATTRLLGRLDAFDQDLRKVIGKFESGGGGDKENASSASTRPSFSASSQYDSRRLDRPGAPR